MRVDILRRNQYPKNWLIGIFLVSCLFPFLSPFPIDTDTQPIFLILASIIVLRNLIIKGLNSTDFYVIFIALSSLMYVNISYDYVVDIGKYVSLLAGGLTYVAISKINHYQAYQIIKKTILFYFIYSCLIYINSELFLSIQENFVRGVNVADISNLEYRGVPTLSTEPGLLGGLLVFFLIQLRYWGELTNASFRELNVYKILVVLMVFMTKSGTGYLYLLLYFIFSVLLDRRIKYLKLISISISLILFIYFLNLITGVDFDNRGIEILVALLSGGTFEADTSILKRIYDIQIGFQSLLNYPLGVGANAVTVTVNELAIRYGLIRINDISGNITLVSGLSYYLINFGLFGVVLLMIVFVYLSKAPVLHKIFALIFMCASYSPAFPAIWILLSQKSRSRFG
jgi:hypothetical protein